ncbi:MAG: hypothetical protein KAG56_02235 [Sulfurovaceae bacterium]|nr:hypothetical protein [Sulfurovaceae bacterium]
MKKFKFLTTALLFSTALSATTIYYNGEGDDIGVWSIIADASTANAAITEVHDDTLNSTVMQFTDGGVYRLDLPNTQLWANTTEKLLSFDMRLNSYYTVFVYVDTLDGPRVLFNNAINVHVGHHGVGILNAIGNGRTHRFERTGWGEEGGSPAFNREGWVRATLDLDRELTDTEPDNRVVRVLSMRVAGTSGRIDNVTLDNPTKVTHGATATDWQLSTGIPTGGTITNHQENEERGNVVSFSGTATSNSYTIGATTGAEAWDDTEHDIIQWKMRTSSNYKFIVHTSTANGARDLIYVTDRNDRALNEDNEIGIGIGWSRDGDGVAYGQGTDGRWQTMIRNVATDISEFDNGNTLTAINGVTIIGTDGRTSDADMDATDILFDDLQLFSSVTPTLATGSAFDLHAWRLRMNSVRISFKDNSEGETGFRYINADTGEQLGVDISPMAGVGASGIAQINGLTHNTAYNISVQTFFADGRASTLSEPLSITTLVDPNAGDESATELNQWRLRADSVRISFKDNAEGETGFRYINDATGTQMGNDLPATDGTGTASIGQINGLTQNTAYTIRVHTLFNDGRETAISEPLTITTLVDPNAGDESANDLHQWRLRANSVRISFKDNAEGETGFRYINDATGTQMGNDLPATDGTGTASIGQINGLTANTEYTVRVQTLFNDGREPVTSESLTFTTLE